MFEVMIGLRTCRATVTISEKYLLDRHQQGTSPFESLKYVGFGVPAKRDPKTLQERIVRWSGLFSASPPTLLT